MTDLEVGIRETPAPDWQPIETAPKIYLQEILLALPNGRVAAGRWCSTTYDRKSKSYNEGWAIGVRSEVAPTHWMPLPEPPVSP